MIVFEVSYAGSRYLLVNGVSKYYAAALTCILNGDEYYWWILILPALASVEGLTAKACISARDVSSKLSFHLLIVGSSKVR